MAFVGVVPEKSLELGDDEKLHRARKEQFIIQSLEAAQLGGDRDKTVKTLRGGGVAVERCGESAKIAVLGPFIAALTGNLHNYGYLVKKYLHEELQLPPTVTLEAIKERMPVTEATLLCHLYAQLGTVMLSKLRGHFSFLLYDSNTVRVLAARDPSGTYPLVQGHFADNALYVTSGSFQPADAQEVVEILPGHYKYGWRAPPRKYSNPEVEVRSHAREASSAANEALAGITCSHQPLAVNPWLTNLGHGGRRSLDGAVRLAPKRNSLDHGRPVSNRRSLDSTVLRNPRQSLDGPKAQSRADEKGWWRAKDDETAARPPVPPMEAKVPEASSPPKKAKRHRKRHRKSKAATKAVETKPADGEQEHSSESGSDHRSVEEFISQLSVVFREDSASARMLTNLLGASPCALVVTDVNQEDEPIVFVNEQFELSTGYTAQEVVGKNCRFLQAASGVPRVPSLQSSTIRRALDTGRSTSVKLMNYMKDGTPVWNDLSIVPLRDTEGKITHHVGMQTFTPAQETPTAKTMVGASSMVRSRSCSDMSIMGKAAPLYTGGLAF